MKVIKIKFGKNKPFFNYTSNSMQSTPKYTVELTENEYKLLVDAITVKVGNAKSKTQEGTQK